MELDNLTRCSWCTSHPLYIKYHDEEWGHPNYDDRFLFEMLTLEGAQAGLSWFTILAKRENYKKAFNNFDAEIVAEYEEEIIQQLMQNPGIVRNQLKIRSTVNNAKQILRLQNDGVNFSNYIWQFTEGKPIHHHIKNFKEIPANNSLSDKMSKDLKAKGFKFVGTTICYAFMQAVGMFNDHIETCWKYNNDH
ncbi:MAG TPA: DNA-3-methyladenine glycosylase I [Saprospiraceae bacterium]|nr:DNA-3-methyladenine glycosylase I [Saprospiraceae bacterium]